MKPKVEGRALHGHEQLTTSQEVPNESWARLSWSDKEVERLRGVNQLQERCGNLVILQISFIEIENAVNTQRQTKQVIYT